jgi:MoxR-like ATPase
MTRPDRPERPAAKLQPEPEPEPEPLPLAEVSRYARAVLDRVGTVIVGKRDALELVLAGILAGGHVLLEDYPGLAKTLAARSLAQSLGLDFRRLQFTPDLLPADVTGSFFYDQREHEFEFRAGPVFTNLLLADEINRTPPKTQAALLEAMQEVQVTVEGRTFPLAAPFHVLATANPIEYEGTYPLPEAQLDRFLLRVSFGYPDRDEERTVLHRRMARRREQVVLAPVIDAPTLRRAQAALENVAVEDSVCGYIVDLVAATREHRSVQVGASPRGSLALLLTARARAVMAGRDYVTPEDVKGAAPAALAHRISLRPEMWLRRVDPADVIAEVCANTPAPRSELVPVYPAATGQDRSLAGARPGPADRLGPADLPGAPDRIGPDPDDPVHRYPRGVR